MSASSLLVNLPEDILLEVCIHLYVLDLLSLKKTCRVLHSFGSSDYLWHRIAPSVDLPLDIRCNAKISDLSAIELQDAVVKAIRLDSNWCSPTPKIRSFNTIYTGERYADEMQLLPGAEWLVTAVRRRAAEQLVTHMCLWSLREPEHAYRTSEFDIIGRFKSFAVTPDKGGETATVAVTLTRDGIEALEVYRVTLEDLHDLERTTQKLPESLGKISHPASEGIIHQVDVHGFVVATTLVVFNVSRLSYRILLFNTITKVKAVVDCGLSQAERLSRLNVKVYDEHIVLMAAMYTQVLVNVHRLPGMITEVKSLQAFHSDRNHPAEIRKKDGLEPPICRYLTSASKVPTDFFDVDCPHYRKHGEEYISMLGFPASYDTSHMDRYIFRIPVALSPSRKADDISYVSSIRFSGTYGTSVDNVRVGRHGRAVWLERYWDLDQVRLMRLAPRSSSGPDKPLVGVLLPALPELPFTPQTCQALAFDEVTGRLCLGANTGGLYILDF